MICGVGVFLIGIWIAWANRDRLLREDKKTEEPESVFMVSEEDIEEIQIEIYQGTAAGQVHILKKGDDYFTEAYRILCPEGQIYTRTTYGIPLNEEPDLRDFYRCKIRWKLKSGERMEFYLLMGANGDLVMFEDAFYEPSLPIDMQIVAKLNKGGQDK